MAQYSTNTTGGISSWRTATSPNHADHEDGPFRIGDDIRYTSGASVNGMEFQPDYFNGKYVLPKTSRCKACGDILVSGRGLHCEKCAPKARGEAIRIAALHRKQAKLSASSQDA